MLVIHYEVELRGRLSNINRRSQKRRLALQLVPRVDNILISGDGHIVVFDACHFHAFLLLELAEVLEPLAITIISMHLLTDRL